MDPDSFNSDPDIFFIKNCNLLMSKLQEKPSVLKREHPELQKMKFINFFLCLGSFLALLDLDPDPDMDPGTPLNPDTDLDQNPQHYIPECTFS